jgi:hypothetical protein
VPQHNRHLGSDDDIDRWSNMRERESNPVLSGVTPSVHSGFKIKTARAIAEDGNMIVPM